MRLFYRFSGLRTNYEKTVVLRLGAWTGTEHKITTEVKLKWLTVPIKILGIMIHLDLDLMKEINYSTLL